MRKTSSARKDSVTHAEINVTNPLTVRAQVRVTLDIHVNDIWGTDCPLDQVEKQATESALGACRGGLVIDFTGMGKTHATIIGQPEVTALIIKKAVQPV